MRRISYFFGAMRIFLLPAASSALLSLSSSPSVDDRRRCAEECGLTSGVCGGRNATEILDNFHESYAAKHALGMFLASIYEPEPLFRFMMTRIDYSDAAVVHGDFFVIFC